MPRTIGRKALEHGLAALSLAFTAGCGATAVEAPDAGGAFTTGDACGTASHVSFASDIVPILAHSCSFAAVCHGDPANSKAHLFLSGTPSSPSDNGIIYANIVDHPATITDMPRVTPGDPSQSFMMHKLDHDQNTSGIGCMSSALAEGPCGEGMPKSGDKLDCKRLETVRAWIEEGASNN